MANIWVDPTQLRVNENAQHQLPNKAMLQPTKKHAFTEVKNVMPTTSHSSNNNSKKHKMVAKDLMPLPLSDIMEEEDLFDLMTSHEMCCQPKEQMTLQQTWNEMEAIDINKNITKLLLATEAEEDKVSYHNLTDESFNDSVMNSSMDITITTNADESVNGGQDDSGFELSFNYQKPDFNDFDDFDDWFLK